ncbi:hypothetical protein OBJ97_13085 [Empedobacter falsenii]
MLRIMFDEEGNMKDEINMKIFSKYINNIKLDKDLIELYKNYPNNIVIFPLLRTLKSRVFI